MKPAAPPKALPQFAGISRHWDPSLDAYVAKLLPGDYYVATGGEWIGTVLGSCVSACVRDRDLRIGGMNHFMLPADSSAGLSAWSEAANVATRFGNVAMEMLINDLMKLGAQRSSLEVKLVGGGKVLEALTDVGARNIAFVREYVRTEGFRVIGEDLGDIYPRRVLFDPHSGAARVMKLTDARQKRVGEREQKYSQKITTTAPTSGDVELF